MLRASVLSHRDWLAANEARHRMRLAWAEFFERYDLLLCPAANVAALPHDQQGERFDRAMTVNGVRRPVTDHLFWAGYSGACLLPSTTAPTNAASSVMGGFIDSLRHGRFLFRAPRGA